jgi:hypothetical protein
MDEVKALDILKKYDVTEAANGVLRFKDGQWKELSEEALEAVSYLFDEWDFVVEIV